MMVQKCTRMKRNPAVKNDRVFCCRKLGVAVGTVQRTVPTGQNVGFSLTGKAPHCECGKQGSNPEANLATAYSSMINKKQKDEKEHRIPGISKDGKAIKRNNYYRKN